MIDDAANSIPARELFLPVVGDYGCQIIRSIGRGAYGEVYLARDATGEYRALKIISRDSFDHDRPFEREFDGIRRFEAVSKSYPNQIQIFSVSRREDPRQFFYTMELADDENDGRDIRPDTYVPRTLRSEMKRRGRLPAAECVTLGLALARAVESLHTAGLIHRDIKPANIIFVQNVPKLADIGLVTDASLSVSHVGTEGFIPPEGPGAVASDIYSLGKVLYEMCTGLDRMDFPDLPAGLPELQDRGTVLEINAIIARACEREPRRRYRSTREMVADFQLIRRGGSVRRKRSVRHSLVMAAKVTLVVAVSALLFPIAIELRRITATSTGIPTNAPRTPIPDDPRNLIVNGSFERPVMPLPGNRLGLFVLDTTYLAPWQTTAGTFEVWADDMVPPRRNYAARSADGVQNLEILSTTNQATVWQTVRTDPGKHYTFSFFHTPRPDVVSTMTVSINSNVIAIFQEDGSQLADFDWRKFTTNFVATGKRTTVSFYDRSATYAAVGTHIDGVVLMPAATDRAVMAR
jgi:serine/threonine protein kinase